VLDLCSRTGVFAEEIIASDPAPDTNLVLNLRRRFRMVSRRALSDSSVRILRWSFRREQHTVVCELGLNHDNSAYELHVDPPQNPTGSRASCSTMRCRRFSAKRRLSGFW
jgi:hypothetical protein